MYDIFEKLLNKKGVTAYRVAKETGISTATLTQWKNGTSTPKQDKLQLIADFFNVTIDYLTGNTDRIYCPDCGMLYNPLDDSNEKNHTEYHKKWEEAVKKYGFCWNYIKSDEEELLSQRKLNDSKLDEDSLFIAMENLLRAKFSNMLREFNFEYHYDFKHFVSAQLAKHSIKDLVPENVFNRLVNKYGIELGDYITSPEFSLYENKTWDIAKDLNKMIDLIRSTDNGHIYFNDQKLDGISLELLANALESAINQIKILKKDKISNSTD
jgi:transcriptional regulator with XRE-family HTH domain